MLSITIRLRTSSSSYHLFRPPALTPPPQQRLHPTLRPRISGPLGNRLRLAPGRQQVTLFPWRGQRLLRPPALTQPLTQRPQQHRTASILGPVGNGFGFPEGGQAMCAALGPLRVAWSWRLPDASHWRCGCGVIHPRSYTAHPWPSPQSF